MVRVKKQVQVLPVSIAEAWAYFSRPENLNEITPPDLSFTILSELPDRVYAGLMICYRLGIYPGVKVNWVTEITHVAPPHYFVDEQRRGPYSMWHHEHHFREVNGGVEMTDIVHYQLPFGWLGDMLHGLLVAPKLTAIFDYRRKALTEQFDSVTGGNRTE